MRALLDGILFQHARAAGAVTQTQDLGIKRQEVGRGVLLEEAVVRRSGDLLGRVGQHLRREGRIEGRDHNTLTAAVKQGYLRHLLLITRILRLRIVRILLRDLARPAKAEK